MKSETRVWYYQGLSFHLGLVFLCCLAFAVPSDLRADGCFVVPKWDKHRDINEPTQKAIIVHNAGREELLLQVKYEGPLEEFGWLIPVPNLPTVKKGSMDCFYELSKFTQKNLDQRLQMGNMSRGTYGTEEKEPDVKVIEVKTVGAYEIAVLSTKDSTALESWLKENQFAVPAGGAGVVDGYVKQGWYFIAVKINLKGGALNSTSKQLASGELNPLKISFASPRCVFPLKISSLNNTPSEVQVYVLSPEPLVEKKLFEKDLHGNYQWRTNMQARLAESRDELRRLQGGFGSRAGQRPTTLPPIEPAPDHQLSNRSEINSEKLIPYWLVAAKDIPSCAREMALLNKKEGQWLMKATWTFKPDEMNDLEFEPAIPVFATALADAEGSLAAANLRRLGTNGVAVLIAGMQNTNAAVRAHATSVAEELFLADQDPRSLADPEEHPRQPPSPERLMLLSTLLNDSDPEVRLHAIYAAMNLQQPIFFKRMLKLLRDDYEEVSQAAQWYLKAQRDEMPAHVPLFRQMLHDTNVNVQIAGLRLLMSIDRVEIPRDELLPLLSVPRMEVAGVAVAYLRKESISCEEAKRLLQNSLWKARMIGLAVVVIHTNNQSVELAIPLLRDPVELIRLRAHEALTELTGQNLPAEQPEQWEQWWEQNKATFTVKINPDGLLNKRLERQRERRRTPESTPL